MSEPIETSQAPAPERPALSRSAIVIVRLLFLIVATGAVFAGIAIAFHDPEAGDMGARYACPMHPEVRASAPGQCPICQMALEPLRREPGGGARSHGAIAGMADLTAVENVRRHKIVDFVRVRSLLPNLREMRGPARVDTDREISAIFYDDQIAVLNPDEPGTFWPTASPGTSVMVTRVAAAVVPRDRSTSLIRFRVDAALVAKGAARGAIEPGQVGWLRLASKSRAVLGVPVSALLQSPEGPYVLISTGGDGFEKRPVEIGETFSRQGFSVVLSGLQASDRVVSRAAFFLDADRRLGGTPDTRWSAP